MNLRSISVCLATAAMGLAALQVDVASQGGRTPRPGDPGPRTVARDPGVRGGEPGAGGPLEGLTSAELKYFEAGMEDFNEIEDVEDGLGPTLNLDGCGSCHSQPAVGGSSPTVNPQVAFATRTGNTTPSFILADGPVREARFIRNPDGTPDGGVHALFTVRGLAGCSLAQPNFESHVASRNVVFRIPTPVFGAGLIEQIPDYSIAENVAADAPAKRAFGIRGRPNFSVAGVYGHRPDEQERQRRHHRAARMEGAEQVAASVFRRGVQRGNGDHERALPE